jgi:flagellar basal-body rod protein FlgC
MIDPLQAAVRVAGSALEAQSLRMRIITENLANAESTGQSSSDDPYTRKTITFGDVMSRVDNTQLVKVTRIGRDDSPFRIVHEPGNPAADERGDVKMPNVDPQIELADLREANRSYQASLQVVKQARELFSMTLDLLKS